jgi:hypothetical protein
MWYDIDGKLKFVELEDEIRFLVNNPQAIEVKNLNYWLESHGILFVESE